MKDRIKLNSGLMFTSGIILVVVAGLIFATTSWSTMSGAGKSGFMVAFSMVLIASSYMAERAGLGNTSNAVYTIGVAFAAITVLGCGKFGLFGDYARIGGKGDMIIYALSALVICVGSVVGGLWHKHRFYGLIGWMSLSVLCVCIFMAVRRAIGFDLIIVNLMLSAYSALMIFMQRLVKRLPYRAIREPFHSFVLINTVVMGVAALAFARDFVTMAVFAVCMLKAANGGKAESVGGVAAGIFMFMAVFYLTSPNKMGDYVFTLAAFTLASSLVGFSGKRGIFGEAATKLIGYIALATTVAAMVICCGELTEDWGISQQVGITILLLNNVLMLREDNVRAKYFQAFIAMLAIAGALMTVNSYVELSDDILFTALGGCATAYFIITLAWKSARCSLSDVVVLGCVGLSGCCMLDYGSAIGFVPIAVYCVSTVYVLWEDKYKISRVFLSVLLPIFLTSCMGYGRGDMTKAVYLAVVTAECVCILATAFIGDRCFNVLRMSLLVAVGLECLIAILMKEIRLQTLAMATLTYGYTTYAHRDYREWLTPTGAVFYGWLLAAVMLWNYIDSISIDTICAQIAMLVPLVAMVIAELWGEQGRRLFKGSIVVYGIGAVFVMLSFVTDIDTIGFVFAVAICVCGYVLICRRGFSLFACIPMATLLVCLIAYAVSLDKYTAVAITCLSFVLINIIGGMFTDRQKIVYTDYVGIIGVFTLLAYPLVDAFWGFALAAVLAVLTAMRADREKIRKPLLAVGIGCAAIALIVQEGVKLPDIIVTEYRVGLTIAAVAGMRRLWNENKYWNLVFYLSCIAGILVLFGAAIISQKVADGIIIGCIGFVTMLTGFALRRRKWYLLGGVTLVFVSIYMTKGFWMSLGWWVYLMLAGMALIGAACFNEWRKK
jgi:hypothetical protein